MDVAGALAEARRATGLTDLGSDHFLPDLELWLADAEGPHLHDRGRQLLRRLAVANLSLRLRLVDTRREIDPDAPLPPVLLVAGFPRSGTTLVHNLFGLHPLARTPRRWELVEPLPRPGETTVQQRIDRVRASTQHLRGSVVEQMHWVDAEDPEECPHGYVDCSGLLGRGSAMATPGWWAHLVDRDEAPTLREYRGLLHGLLAREPVPDGGVLVLKSPTTSPHLETFARVFPEARFVLCHRDPWRATTSAATLITAVSEPFCVPGTSLADVLPHGLDDVSRQISSSARAMVRLSEHHAERVVNIGYATLMGDPSGCTAKALGLSGWDPPDDWDARVGAFLEWQHRGGRAHPPRSYDQPVTEASVRAQPDIAAYVERFGVAIESERVTAPRR